MMIALIESSSANLRRSSTTSLGSMMTPSRSTTPIFSPKACIPAWRPLACSAMKTRVNTASTKRKKAPPPISTHNQTRERPFSAIQGCSLAPHGERRDLFRDNDLQGLVRDSKFGRSSADVFAVGVNIEWRLRLDANAIGLIVFDFFR